MYTIYNSHIYIYSSSERSSREGKVRKIFVSLGYRPNPSSTSQPCQASKVPPSLISIRFSEIPLISPVMLILLKPRSCCCFFRISEPFKV